jgi:hypothetical protein
VYDRFLEAESKGRYFLDKIKNEYPNAPVKHRWRKLIVQQS